MPISGVLPQPQGDSQALNLCRECGAIQRDPGTPCLLLQALKCHIILESRWSEDTSWTSYYNIDVIGAQVELKFWIFLL